MSQKKSFEEWFEELSSLAKNDPQAFERRRLELIKETIAQSCEDNRPQLQKLQWRIEMERKRAKTPLASCIRLHDMLMEMVYGEGGFLEAINVLRGILQGLENRDPQRLRKELRQFKERPCAEIIPFPKRPHHSP